MNYIKLGKSMINLYYVSAIVKQSGRTTLFGNKIPEKYKIYLSTNKISGFSFFGSGFVESENRVFNVCSKDDPEEFKTLEDFITKYKPLNN